MAIRYSALKGPSCGFTSSRENAMVKTPNYKQEKRRREDAQRKRHADEQERQAARKKGAPTYTPQ
jgi:hypothetical protein